MNKRKRKVAPSYTYSLWHELSASTTEPMPAAKRDYQMARMLSAMATIELGARPTADDWRMCVDAVNLLETLVEVGTWRDCDGDPVEVRDADGLIGAASQAMAQAARRHVAGQAIRLDGAGISAMRGVLADYSSLLDNLPAREIIRAHRLTERRIYSILAGKRKPHNVEILDLTN